MSGFATWIIIFVLILLNSIFVVSEIAIIAAKRSKLLTSYKKRNSSGAKFALKLKELPELFLSTIQIGITLFNILLGMFTGKELSDDFARWFGFLNLSPEAEAIVSYGMTLILITYLTVLGEIIPKRVALSKPEQIAVHISKWMFYASYMFYPFVKSLNFLTKLCLLPFRAKLETNKYISIDEIKFMVNQARVEGVFEKTEYDIIRRIINLNDMQVRAIMTPRFDIEFISEDDSIKAVKGKITDSAHTFFPLIKDDFFDILGIVSTKKFFASEIKDKKKLNKAFANFIYIPDLAKVTSLIENFRENKAQVAIVVDEHGSIEGMITINDIFKIFINDLAHLNEEKPPAIKKVKNGYIADGNISADEAMELMQLNSLDGDTTDKHNDYEYKTLASFVVIKLGRIAQKGDIVYVDKWKIVVREVQNFRIKSFRITKIESQT